MLTKILAALGIGTAPSAAPAPPADKPKPRPVVQRASVRRKLASSQAISREMHIRPYRDETCNFIYNLLFCDNPALFDGSAATPWGAVVFAAAPDPAALRAIAMDSTAYDSRTRMLAFNRLREIGEPVPAKVLLGVIVEVPLENGLDTLAAFADGGVRFIHNSEKMGFYEGTGHPWDEQVRLLLATAQFVVDQIGPGTGERLPPPAVNGIRITFLVSDGVYIGEGPYEVMARDEKGRPVIVAGLMLLQTLAAHGTATA